MKLIRSLAACSAVALGLSLAQGIAPPASAAGVLVTNQATLSATPGQTLPLAALFQPVRVSSPGFQYLTVVVTLTGGLTFADGAQVIAGQGSAALPSVLGIPVTAKSSGTATLKVTALLNNAATTDEATTTVDVPAPAPPPGEVRFLTTVGTASAKKGQVLQLGSLFKAVEGGKQFNFVRTIITVEMTGGLVFTANGEQSTALAGTVSALPSVLSIPVMANSSGTVTIKVTAKTATFDITDEATAAVNVPTPGPAPVPPTVPAAAPATTAAPAPATTAAPAPGATGPPASSGNRPPTAVGKSVVVKASTATAIALKGTDPEGAALVYSIVDFPENGRLTGRAPNLTYLPEKGFVGTDAFSFTVSDRVSTSEEAVVSITVISAKKVVVRKTTKKKK